MENKAIRTETEFTFTDNPIGLDVLLNHGDIVENLLPVYIVWGVKPDGGGATVELEASGGKDALEKAKELRPDVKFIASHKKRT